MANNLDLMKLRKGLTKNIPGLAVGFNDPVTWIDTGNYVLNYFVSGDFYRGIPLEGKVTIFAGESQTGKSYIASANVIRWAQQNDVVPVLIDTENALDSDWFEKLDVDPENMIRIASNTVDQITQSIEHLISDYKSNYKPDTPREEKQRMVIIIDSLGMAVTSTELTQAKKGDMKGDLGRKAKQLTSMARIILSRIAGEPIGVIGVQHTYKSQDPFSPDDVIAGGNMMELAPRVIIASRKRKLKEDEEGQKTKEVQGVRVDAMVIKTNWGKPFQKVTFDIPYDRGMDRYSGLFNFLEHNNILERVGNRYCYKSLLTGDEVFTEFRKNITLEQFDLIMKQFMLTKDKTKEEIKKLAEKEAKKNKNKEQVEEPVEEQTITIVDQSPVHSIDVTLEVPKEEK